MRGAGADRGADVAAIAVEMSVTKQQWDSSCAGHATAAEQLVTMREKYVQAELG